MTIHYLQECWKNSHQYLKMQNNYRELSLNHNNNAIHKIDFSSNDYLDMRLDARLMAAAYENAQRNGIGTGASRSVLQNDDKIEEVEKFFCENTNYKHTLFLPSGFLANLTFFDVLSPFSFEKIEQEIFVDHRVHASIFYALKNRGIKSTLFRHNDYKQLENKLKNSTTPAKIIVVESLYSMDGDFSCPESLYYLCDKYKALLFLDEVHTFGIYGQHGNGWVSQFPQLKKYILASVVGCGKAVGVCGGFLATDSLTFHQRIIQKSKSLIYSTAPSPSITGAVYKSLQIILSGEGDIKRKALDDNINFFKKICGSMACHELNLLSVKEISHIIPIIIGDNESALEFSNYLFKNNFIVKAIRPPSVPNRTARLRVILTAKHSHEEINKLIILIANFFQKKS